MKKLFLAVCSLVFLASISIAGGFLSSDTYVLTTNSATRSITVTNFPTAGVNSFEWFPSAILFNNRGSTTGELLRIEHVRAGITNYMVTNTAISVTNTLYLLNSAAGISTNWVPDVRWYLIPASDKLQISTVCTNGEIILQREVSR